jgi:hypothetical protein
MISKEDFLNAEFLKQFKDSKEFSSFMENCMCGALKKCSRPKWIIIWVTKNMRQQGEIRVIPITERRLRRSKANMGR